MEIRFSPSDLVELTENGGATKGHPGVCLLEQRQTEDGLWWERRSTIVLVPELNGHALGNVAAFNTKEGWVDVVYLDENNKPLRVEREHGKVTLVLRAGFLDDWRQIITDRG